MSKDGASEDVTKSESGFDFKAAVYFGAITGMALVGGFGMTLGLAKKKDPVNFVKGAVAMKGDTIESGGKLASRALGRATLYSVGSFALFCGLVWKAMDVHTFAEFRHKMGSSLPRLTPTAPPQTRTEFDGLRDFFEYVIELDEEKRAAGDKKPQLIHGSMKKKTEQDSNSNEG